MLDPNPNGCAERSNADTGEADEVTATVTATAPPPRGTPNIAEFMSAVVPFPGSNDDPGWCNLHWQSKPDPKYKNKTFFPGYPYRSPAGLMSGLSRMLGRPDFYENIFFCVSMQEKTKPKKNGKPGAVRSAEAALALKAIFMDVDIKQFADDKDAVRQTLKFIDKVGLPAPTVVHSGGGYHFYWISKKPLTKMEWLRYAEGLKALHLQEGLKADAMVTADAARVLRVPGTFNHKYDPPRPVKLLTPTYEYDFSTAPFQNLLSYTPAVSATATEKASIFFKGTADGFGAPCPLFANLTGKLSDGCGPANTLVDPAPILKECGFYRNALANGGADYDQGLWMLSVLGSTFMENGHAFAHEISKGHRSYTPDDTDAMFNRKMAERDKLGLGYPSCAAIKSAGCKDCANCPLFSQGKSPLNIRPKVAATATAPPNQANWTSKLGVSLRNIPHRKWLYGVYLVRGELTVIGSPGGAGKSSLAIGMAICIATNRELLGEKIRGRGDLKALVINGEDSTDEIRRRVYAFTLQHGLVESDLGRLTVVGANDAWVQRISFLTTNGDKSALNQGGLDALQTALDALRPDVVVLDPLVSFCAGGNINDNAVMSLVMRKLKEIAARYECAVLIVHHTRKGGDAGNVEAISGAASITNLARRAIMPTQLSEKDLKDLTAQPSERFQYFKLADAKSNLAPRAVDAPVYRLVNVELPNPEPPLYPSGDNVQAITRVVLPTQPIADPNELKIQLAIMELVDEGKEIDGQAYPYSPSLAGAKNKRALLPDAMKAAEKATAPRQWLPGDLEAAVKAAVDKMLSDGRLVDEAMPKSSRFRRGRGLRAVPI